MIIIYIYISLSLWKRPSSWMTPPREQCCNTTSGCDFGTCDVLHEVLYIPGGAGFPSTVWLNHFLKTKTQLIGRKILPFIALLLLVVLTTYTSFLSTVDTKVLRSRWPRSLPRIPFLAKTSWTKTGSKSTRINKPPFCTIFQAGFIHGLFFLLPGFIPPNGERPEYDHLLKVPAGRGYS